MFLGISLFFSNNVYSQNQKVSLNLKDSNLYEIFKLISNQTDYKFIYNKSIVENERIIDLKIENKSVKVVLKYLFDKRILEYKIKDNLIVINKMSEQKFLQKNIVIIKGVIKDDEGFRLPGAPVSIEGTSIKTLTNIDGEYSLKFVNTGNIKITFSYAGFYSKIVNYKGQKNIDVILFPSIQIFE